MNPSQMGMMIAMAVYLLVMIAIGFMASEQNNTVGDFYLGGRKLGAFVTAMSAEASDMSSWLLMGLPGVAYLTGLADAGWTAIGLALGTYFNWLIVAKKLRHYSERIDAITIPEFFAKRFKAHAKTITLVAALVIITFFVPYTASGFAACGKLFNSLFGIDYHLAMIVSAIVIILYTTLGGFLAASTTDFLQSIVMSIALIIVVTFGIGQAGGIGNVINNAKNLAGYFSLTASHIAETGASTPYGFITIVSTMAWGLGYFGMPHILLRFMAIEDSHKLKLSRRVASIWVVISMGVSVFIGVVGLAMSKAGVIPVLTGNNSETVIIQIANLLSTNGFIFAIIAGVVLSGILASTMSTADSQLLAASSAVSNDILSKVMHKEFDNQTLLKISRVCLLIIAVIAVFLAWNPDSSVFRIVSFAWAGFGASFGPCMLLALFWRRSNGAGALAGMLSGGVMIFVWKFLVRPMGGAWNIYELLPAFLVALAVNVIVSLITPAPEQSVTDDFDYVQTIK